jgi:MBG domain (YGX type)/FG-GAP-like repeat
MTGRLLIGIAPVLVCLVLAGGAARPAQAAVNPATTLQLGFSPNLVMTADMNGDGKLDLVASGNAQAVFLGNGDGTFQAPMITSGPGSASAAALGDFNGDGKPDLAVASSFGGVTVLLGNGDGTFRQPIFVNSDPFASLAAADLTGDGSSDLVVNSVQTRQTTVFIAKGDGTLQAGPRYSSTGGGGVILTDFNGDGRIDMVRLNGGPPAFNGGSLAEFFAGVGDGTFLAPVRLSILGTVATVGDLNVDGKPDLALVSDGCIFLMLGNGDGSFAYGGTTCNGIQGGNPVVADFNGDGKPDVEVAQIGAITTMLGDGIGGLANASVSPTSVSSDHSSAAGDFNGDGRVDLAVTNIESGSLTIYLNDGATSYPVGGAQVSPSSLAFGSVPAWGTSAPQAVTLTNTGPGYLYLTGRTGFGNFSQSNGCLPSTLVAPGASCTVQVTFTPSTSGSQTGGMSIFDSAPSGSQSATFSGTGTINPSTTTVSPASGTQGGTVNLTGTLASNGAPLAAGGSVTLSLPNGWTGRSFTDSKGNFGWFGASLAGLASGVYPGGIKATYSGDGAYTGSSATADLTVTAPAPVIAVAPANGTYGGPANLAATITQQGSPLSGLTLSFAVNGVPAGTATTDAQGTASLTAQLGGLAAGDHPTAVSATFAGDGVYSSSSATGDLIVHPAPLTITASSATITYGGARPAVTASYAGFVNGDTAAALSAAPTCTSSASSQPAVGTYTTSCSGAADGNYTIGYVTGSLAVGQAPLTITASSATMTYGGARPAVTASYAGFVNGDTAASLAAAPTCTSSASSQPAVGTYTTSCSGAADGNYTIGYVKGSLAVGQAPLTITASSATITYGGAPPAVTASYGGFVNGDTAASLAVAPRCTSIASSKPAVGTYTTSCSSAAAANYSIAYVAGRLAVGPAPLTVTANSPSRLFGASNPGLTVTISGFVNGDSGAAINGAASCTTAAAPYSPGGSYPIACTQGTLSAVNYTFGPFVPGTLKVGYSTTISGSVASVTVLSGQSVLIAPGAVVKGPLKVQPGGALDMEGASTGSQLTSSGAVAIRICGANVAGLTVGGTMSLVLVGDDEVTPSLPACAGNRINGPVTIKGNFGGVEFDGNTVTGPLTVTGNTGSTPDGGTVDVVGNTVGGKSTIQP